MLLGCAGSPLHTGSLSPETLRAVDNYTLCKAYTPRPLYSPNMKVVSEVLRRQLNCRAIYQFEGTANIEAAIRGLQMIQGNQRSQLPNYGGIATGIAHIRGERTSGHNKICFYDRMGSAYAITIGATDLCPITQSKSQRYDGIATGIAHLKSERTSGHNKICFYDRMGSAYAITIGATDLCPLTQ